jgi:CSLREA domain-containing protein
MWLEVLRRRWFGKGNSSRKIRKGRPARPGRPALEALEDRTVPTTFVVTSFADSNAAGAGSLRDAVLAANADAGTATDVIQLQAGTYTLSLQSGGARANDAQSGSLNINNTAHTLLIEGTGSTGTGATVIDASGLDDRAFQVAGGVTVEFENLTIKGGLAHDDGATGATPGSTDAQGGGLLNLGGNVLLTNVQFSRNSARGGAGHNAQGAGIYTSGGSLTLNNSVVVANQLTAGPGASGHLGGGGAQGGSGQGGGLYAGGGTVNLTNDLIRSNQALGGRGGTGANAVAVFTPAQGGGGGQGGSGQGGGVYVAGGTVNLAKDTLQGNTAWGGERLFRRKRRGRAWHQPEQHGWRRRPGR